MSEILLEKDNHVAHIILNRADKHNAFNDTMILSLLEHFKSLSTCSNTRAIIIRANGKNFSAGADLNWMKGTVNYSKEENINDALALANLLHLIHHHRLPTISLVQGGAFGGGAGIVAASDIAIGTKLAAFSFSEVKLGLIPSAISPYVIKALGPRWARRLFITGEKIDSETAKHIGLLHEIIVEENLIEHGAKLAHHISNNSPNAITEAKKLIDDFAFKAIDELIINESATRIAEIRTSADGQEGLSAFLEKRKPNWS